MGSAPSVKTAPVIGQPAALRAWLLKCFLIGGCTPQQRFFKTADGLTAGHTGQKQGQEIDCALFDRAYPIGVDDEATQRRREEKIEEAKKKKGNALQTLRRKMKEVVGGNKR